MLSTSTTEYFNALKAVVQNAVPVGHIKTIRINGEYVKGGSRTRGLELLETRL